MALLRGKLFAGALFAGLLFGPHEQTKPTVPYQYVDEGSSYKQKKTIKVSLPKHIVSKPSSSLRISKEEIEEEEIVIVYVLSELYRRGFI